MATLTGGAGGGGAGEGQYHRGGPGGTTVGTFDVEAGDVLEIKVGEGGVSNEFFQDRGGGWPGGGLNSERPGGLIGGGGGYSSVFKNGVAMLVAGGGGGGTNGLGLRWVAWWCWRWTCCGIG